MMNFAQTFAACMSDWHAEVARFKNEATIRVRHRLINLGLAHIPFFIDEVEQHVELDHVLLPNPQQWYPHLCQMLDIEPERYVDKDDAAAALESHLWQVYADYVNGRLEETQQVVEVDSTYRVSTWLSADDGYRAVVRTNTHIVARTEHGLRTRLDAMLAALWQLKSACQAPALTYEH